MFSSLPAFVIFPSILLFYDLLDCMLQIWQAEWDMTGMTLASLGSSGIVRLWQANLKGEWEECTQYHRF